MHVKQVVVRNSAELPGKLASLQEADPGLLLIFGSVGHLTATRLAETLGSYFPHTVFLGCSTAGEITPDGVEDGSCTITALHFEQTPLTQGATRLTGMEDSFAAGERLGRQIAAVDLKAVLVFGPGVKINGSALVNGISSVIGSHIPITGGLAGDAGAFKRTFTLGKAGVADDYVVAVGLCGDQLRFGHGSFGGWEAFGPARKVTRCEGNVLYELDGEPALGIYKRYLGEHARDLPASGLLFRLPCSVKITARSA